jgi:AraC-like DNA-binding protein/ligand-binding sensor protein
MRSCKELIAALESQFGCRACFHDYDGRIIGCAGTFPLHHMNPVCEVIRKPRRNFQLCCEMEAELTRSRLQSGRSVFAKRCHAGLFELATPVFRGGALTGSLFLGPFRQVEIDESFGNLLHQEPFSPSSAAAKAHLAKLPSLDLKTARNLRVFAELVAKGVEETFSQERKLSSETSRLQSIRHFIDCNFRRELRLAELAQLLGVGEVRACQIVRAEFGASFTELLLARRLEHAKYLLAASLMKIEDVAAASAFRDASYFFKAFKRETGTTPLEYRRKMQKNSPVGAALQA